MEKDGGGSRSRRDLVQESVLLYGYFDPSNVREKRTSILVNRREKIIAYAAWGAVCLFWGTTYLAIRVGVQSLPPALFLGARFLVAGSIFVPYLKWRGFNFPQRKELANIAFVGFALLVLANGGVVWAEQWVPSGLAALVVATLPFWMAGFEAALPSGNKMTLRKGLGIIIGFMGLVILFGSELRDSFDVTYFKGILALLFSPFCWALGSIYSKSRPIGIHPLMAAGFQMLIAGFILVIGGVLSGEVSRIHLDASGLVALAYLILFGSIVGYGSFVYALSKLPATKVSMYAYVNPVIAVVLGWLILGERMDWIVLSSTAIVLCGVILVKSSRQ
jgi:drug/metabolite transporter (DMT)-like permease